MLLKFKRIFYNIEIFHWPVLIYININKFRYTPKKNYIILLEISNKLAYLEYIQDFK